MLVPAALVLIGYLAGSVATAVITCRLLGLPDPRGQGSGNPGATNVLRLGGRVAGAATLAGDVLKGVLPVLLARLVSDAAPVLAATALAAFLGHLYPVFFRFRGGKGVATAFGALAALAWPVAAAVLATWAVVAALFRYASLASVVAALAAPVYAALLAPLPAYVGCVALMAALLLWRHRGNLRRLLDGSESRIGAR